MWKFVSYCIKKYYASEVWSWIQLIRKLRLSYANKVAVMIWLLFYQLLRRQKKFLDRKKVNLLCWKQRQKKLLFQQKESQELWLRRVKWIPKIRFTSFKRNLALIFWLSQDSHLYDEKYRMWNASTFLCKYLKVILIV